jgi:hypothetical protein
LVWPAVEMNSAAPMAMSTRPQTMFLFTDAPRSFRGGV